MKEFISELFLSAHKTSFNFHDLVLISATLVAVLLASLIKSSDSGHKHRLLVLFFATLGLGQLNFMLTYNLPIHVLLRAPFGGDVFNWSALPYFLQGPLLFSYINQLASKRTRLSLVTAGVVGCFVVLNLLDPVARFGGILESIFWRDYVLTGTVGFLISFGLALQSLRTIYRNQETIRSQLDSSSPVSLSWLWRLVLGLTAIWWVEAMAPFIYGHTPFLFEQFAIYTKNVATLLLLIWLFKHWNTPQRVMAAVNPEQSQESGNSPGLAELENLQAVMKNSALFRNHDLTIQEFSEHLKLPPRTVSQWINNGLNKNFYEFVNEFRLNQAKERLLDPAHEEKSIQWIYLDVGFRSKSSFNTLFKKHFGTTPSAFREKYLRRGEIS